VAHSTTRARSCSCGVAGRFVPRSVVATEWGDDFLSATEACATANVTDLTNYRRAALIDERAFAKERQCDRGGAKSAANVTNRRRRAEYDDSGRIFRPPDGVVVVGRSDGRGVPHGSTSGRSCRCMSYRPTTEYDRISRRRRQGARRYAFDRCWCDRRRSGGGARRRAAPAPTRAGNFYVNDKAHRRGWWAQQPFGGSAGRRAPTTKGRLGAEPAALDLCPGRSRRPSSRLPTTNYPAPWRPNDGRGVSTGVARPGRSWAA